MNENPYAPPQAYDSSTEKAGATIRVTRSTSYADRIRAYRILIDGRQQATIKAGQNVDIPVTAGHHSVVAKIDWCGSPTLDLNIAEGQTITLACGSNLLGLRGLMAFVYVFFLPNEYLTLIQEA